MGRKSKLPGPEEIHRLYYTEKMSMQAIGERYGVSREAVRQAMEKNHFTRRTQKEAQALVQKESPTTADPEESPETEQEEGQTQIVIHT